MTTDDAQQVWMVVYYYPDSGATRFAGVWIDEEQAGLYAMATNGLLIRLPVAVDYRTPRP